MFDEKVVVCPPKPITKAMYVCDNTFHTGSVLELYKRQDLIGVVFILGAESSFHVVDANAPRADPIEVSDRSARLRSHNKGGQSSARFGRIHLNKVKEYLKALAEDLRLELADRPEIGAFVVAGTTTRRQELLPYLHRDVEAKLVGIVTCETLEAGMEDVLKLYREHLHRLECHSLQQFTTSLELDSGLAVYGGKELSRALKRGELKTIWVHIPSVEDAKLECIRQYCFEGGTELVCIEDDHTLFRQYGAAVGLRYFAAV